MIYLIYLQVTPPTTRATLLNGLVNFRAGCLMQRQAVAKQLLHQEAQAKALQEQAVAAAAQAKALEEQEEAIHLQERAICTLMQVVEEVPEASHLGQVLAVLQQVNSIS